MSDFEVVEIGFYDILESEVVISEPSMLSVLLFGGGQDVTLAEDHLFFGNDKGIPEATSLEDSRAKLGIPATGVAPIRPISAKTTLVDADEVTGNDSASLFSQIRTTWANIKVFLKTYFDTLYEPKNTNIQGHISSTSNPHNVTTSQIGAQVTLESGTNIKTINNQSLLGSGNITISTGITEAQVKAISKKQALTYG